MSDNPSVQDAPIVSHDRVADAVRSQLDTAINIERRFTAEELANRSGVSLSAIRSYMRNEAPKDPSLSRALSLMYVLGERAVNALLHLIRYQAQPLDAVDSIQPMQIVADALSQFAVIGQAARDNRIDHVEEPATTAAADALIATIIPLSSAGKGK